MYEKRGQNVMKKYFVLMTLLVGFSATKAGDIYDQELETENPANYFIGSFEVPDIKEKTLFNNDQITIASNHVKISLSPEIAPFIKKNKIQIRHRRTTYTVNTTSLTQTIEGIITLQSDWNNAPIEHIRVTISPSN